MSDQANAAAPAADSQSPADLSRAHLAKCLIASPIYGFLMSEASIHPSTSKGKSIATLTLTSAHVNSKGSLHGSVSATMVDWSSGNALATMGSHSGVSVDMHVSFLSGKAKVGDVIVIEGTIDRLGRTLAFTNVKITKEDTGELVILANGARTVLHLMDATCTRDHITPTMEPREWQHGGYLVSTRLDLLQPDAVNDALGSSWMYWTQRERIEDVQTMLRNSLCFGVYERADASSEEAIPLHPSPRPALRQIGLGRIITDYITFVYLTDMYILPEYRGKGLARAVVGDMHGVFSSWPLCRRLMFITEQGEDKGQGFYEKVLDGCKQFEQGKNGYIVMSKSYEGALGKLR